jgi:DNA processing protein
MRAIEARHNADSSVKRLGDCLWLSALFRCPELDRSQMRHHLSEGGALASLADCLPRRLESLLTAEQPGQRPDQGDRAPFYDQAAGLVKQGIGAVSLADAEYPLRLRQISGCPPVLYYRGAEAWRKWNHPGAVTVIGTRTPSGYGLLVTRQIVRDLADRGVLVLSGLARGIDALAHSVTLERGGLTIAVVAHGVDQVYPPEHRRLLERIVESGLVVSEHPPGTSPRRTYFPARNRILSGLADLVAVMEASQQSGSLITAGFAADQGRDVFAVPGSILTATHRGCNHLIRDGAGLLETAADLLAQLDASRLSGLACANTAPERTPLARIGMSDLDRQRLRLMAGLSLQPAELAVISGCSEREATTWLGYQETFGLVCRERGRYTLTEQAFSCI